MGDHQNSSRFSFHARQEALRRMATETFDLCIIGGGITGAGVARDACSRGMKVCLIEQNDFASGTSSRSSKLIHGGIRYLENLEFKLVFEALTERRILFEIAPHLVHPLEFVLPLYQGGRVGMFRMGLGMFLYDALALFNTPKYHERLSPAQTITRLPFLSPEGLEGSYVYSDAYMDDDRLVIETLRSAHEQGALCANYVKAGGGDFDRRDNLVSIEAEDRLTERQLKIKAHHFISTVGPWTDQFANMLFEWRNILRPTKGVHLTFSRQRFPLKDAVVMAAEKRIVFGIPRHEMVIIGTTDTDFEGDPADVHTEASDVQYLLGVVDRYFSNAGIGEKDILASYAGVRPLVNDGSSTESRTSREHVIIKTPHRATFVAGGKYTTYRRMAEQIVDKVLPEFPIDKRIQFAKNSTKTSINPKITKESLARCRRQSRNWVHEYGIGRGEAEILAQRHGPEALEILELGRQQGLSGVWEKEASFAIQNTMCLKLADFMLRRSPLFLATSDHGLSDLDNVGRVFQRAYGWSDETLAQEKRNYMKHFETELGWKGKLSRR